jgi:AI-2 transport protein TqsA
VSKESNDDALKEIGAVAAANGGRERRQQALVWLVGSLAVMAWLWALKVTAAISIPVFVAFFLAIAVWPVVEWIRERVPRWLGWLGYVGAMAIIVLALALFCLGIWYAAASLAQGWSEYADKIRGWWEAAIGWVGGMSNGTVGAGAGSNGTSSSGGNGGGSVLSGQNPVSFVSDYALAVVGSFWRVIAVLVLVFFFTLLMLSEAESWRAKLEDVTDRRRTKAWMAAVMDVSADFRWYVLVRTALGAATALLYGFWLWVWGVDFVPVWMLLAFLLNFIPTLGSIVSGILPTAFAFVQVDLGTALLVAGGILAIEQVMGNYIDPLLQGRQLSISPLIVLISLLLWGWIWGVAGALLAVPMTVLVIMIAARVPALEGVALALSQDRTRAALAKRLTRSEAVPDE